MLYLKILSGMTRNDLEVLTEVTNGRKPFIIY